jgi:hypothetical protein
MRARKELIFLLWLLVLVATLTTTSTAQNRSPSSVTYSPATKTLERNTKPPALRPLTADEGLAILSAALESRGHPDAGSDCSHLVHAVYERAGFPYSYASSSALYAGNEEFQRVARPQPGDLVVWPGHVGIAVDPAQHSFFSALRAGLGVESYDSAYWRERGHPRFFRYVTASPATNRVATSSREATLKTAASSESHPPSSRNISFDTTDAPQLQVNSVQSSIPFVTVHSQRPTPSEVNDALERALSETGERLRGLDLLNPSKPVIVFDQLSVERVRLKRDQGWADVGVAGALKISGTKTKSTKHSEHQHWRLVRRGHDGWEIIVPSEVIYVQSDLAIRILAHQLAALTDETVGQPGAGEEKLQLSRLLNVFLGK